MIAPLPLSTGDNYSPWDDLFRWGYTLRLSWKAPARFGLGFALRRYVSRHLAFEVGGDFLIGADGRQKWHRELPVTLDALFYPYRLSDFHFYGLFGAGNSWTWVKRDGDTHHETNGSLRLGAGVMFLGARNLGWNFDAVGFVDEPRDGHHAPYAYRPPRFGGSADRGGGVVLRIGMSILERSE